MKETSCAVPSLKQRIQDLLLQHNVPLGTSLSQQATEGVFVYLLRLPVNAVTGKSADGWFLNRRLRAIGMTPEESKRFREDINFSQYASCIFWRAMVLYIQGQDINDILRAYPDLHVGDLSFCEDSLSDHWYDVLIAHSAHRSVYMLTDEEMEDIFKSTKKTAIPRAAYKIRFIKMYDPAFDAEEELAAEAMRAIYRYSDIPDIAHVAGKVAVTVSNSSKHLIQYHTSKKRRRIEKVPEWRCPCCKSLFRLEKETMTTAQAVEKEKRPLPPVDRENRIGPTRFCLTCYKKNSKVVPLDNLDTGRVYRSLLVSIDTGGSTEDGDSNPVSLTNIIPDERTNPEEEVVEKDFIRHLTATVPGKYQEVLRTFLTTPPVFIEWLREQGIRRDVAEENLLHLVYEYFGVSVEETTEHLGVLVSKPKAFIVRCGEFETGDEVTQDIVFARSPKEAAKFVAKEYRYGSLTDMRRDLGRIRVKLHPSFESSVKFPLGHVMPMEVSARGNRREAASSGSQR